MRFIIIPILMLQMIGLHAQKVKEMDLYEGPVPNSIPSDKKEYSTIAYGFHQVYQVTRPTLTMYAPEKPNGLAVIVCPGGGYAYVSIDKEGVDVAKALNTIGVTAFILKYRLPNDTLMTDKSIGPLQDAQQAIRLVRQRSNEFGIRPDRIGVMGFSAGGHLASSAATHFNFKADVTVQDTTSVRPDMVMLIYPVISFDSTIMHKGSRNRLIGAKPGEDKTLFFSNEMQVSKSSPPAFIVHAGDDPTVPVENSLRYYRACIIMGVPAEMHLYPKGRHGFGLKNTSTADLWFDRLTNWLKGFQ